MSRNAVLSVVAACLAVVLWVTAMWNSGDASSDASIEPAEPEASPVPSAPTVPVVVDPDPDPEPPDPARRPEAPEPEQPAADPQPAGAFPFGAMPPPAEEGPLDELREQFEREARASSAHELETLAETAFKNPNVDPKLFDSVLCHETVCRLRMRWSSDRMIGYIAALTILRTQFAPVHAVSPAKADDSDGSRALEVYIRKRRPDDPSSFPTQPPQPTP